MNKTTQVLLCSLLLSIGISCSDDSVISHINPKFESCDFDYDVPPYPIKIVLPTIPEGKEDRHIEGNVTLRFYIDSEGYVFYVALVHTDLERAFVEAAKHAAMNYEFIPALKDGNPCCSKENIAIGFRPR